MILNLFFRSANLTDISQIVAIHNSNFRHTLNSFDQGFLLTEINEDVVNQNLKQGSQYFVALHREDEVLGFVCISQPKISSQILTKINIDDLSYHRKIQDSRHRLIQVVAIHPHWKRQGVAQFLYRSIYQKFPKSYFSLFIVINPIYNQRSMTFHQKQGFQQIGTIKAEKFLDLTHYEDALMFKEL